MLESLPDSLLSISELRDKVFQRKENRELYSYVLHRGMQMKMTTTRPEKSRLKKNDDRIAFVPAEDKD